MNAFIRFNKGLLRSPWPVKIWLMALMAANMVAPLFFIGHIEAQLSLAAIMAGGIFMMLLTARFGFSRILGLGHIFWIPLVIWLALRLDLHPADQALGIWMRILIVLNSLSLLIDTTDVIRYLAGDRKETVTGLDCDQCQKQSTELVPDKTIGQSPSTQEV